MTDTKLGPEVLAELKAAIVGVRERRIAAKEHLENLLVEHAPALIAAAERCGEAEQAKSVDDMAFRMLKYFGTEMAEQLDAAIARAEAAEEERDRMRPVVEAAVAEYRAADAANDETEPDDTQVQRNGRWAKAETTLHIAVHNYLDNDHAKGGG